MKKLYFLTVCLLASFAALAQTTNETINGKLTVTCDFLGGVIAKDEPATIELIPTGDNTCTFKLPDFTLSDLGELGDIVVTGVKVAEANDVKTYTGEVKGLLLAENSIKADVALNGIVDATDKAHMDIDVLWDASALALGLDQIPIKVVFDGQLEAAGVENVVVDENAPIEYYNLNGIRVANPENGIYIRRQGNKVSKVLVK